PVINVVTSAIKTIIVKIRPERIPRSYPIFSTTSSTSPLVFMSTPIEKDCDQLIPVQRLINMLPPSLPAIATTIINAHINQSCQSFSSPTCVRNPVKAKKSGSSAYEPNASSLSLRKTLNSTDGG